MQRLSIVAAVRAGVRRAILEVLYQFGVCALFDRLNRCAPRVVTYHGIVADSTTIRAATDLPLSAFEQHIAWLAARYRLVGLAELAQAQDALAITFDDGCRSDLERAAPVLERFGARGTFFVCSDIAAGLLPGTWHDIALVLGVAQALAVGQDAAAAQAAAQQYSAALEAEVHAQRLDDPYPLLERDFGAEVYDRYRAVAPQFDAARFSGMRQAELHAIVARGHRVGSHSRRHRVLAHLASRPEALAEDLASSRVTLTALAGFEVIDLAYPYGTAREVSPAVETAARQAGYHDAFRNDVPCAVERWRLPRLQVPPRARRAELYAYTSGLHHFLRTGRLLPCVPALKPA